MVTRISSVMVSACGRVSLECMGRDGFFRVGSAGRGMGAPGRDFGFLDCFSGACEDHSRGATESQSLSWGVGQVVGGAEVQSGMGSSQGLVECSGRQLGGGF